MKIQMENEENLIKIFEVIKKLKTQTLIKIESIISDGNTTINYNCLFDKNIVKEIDKYFCNEFDYNVYHNFKG